MSVNVLRNNLIVFFLFVLFTQNLLGSEHNSQNSATVKFIENKGQWIEKVNYKADLPFGSMFLENNSIIYAFNNSEDLERLHQMGHGMISDFKAEDFIVHGHCFKMNFKNSNPSPEIHAEDPTIDYINYYLGKNPSKWATNVRQYTKVAYDNIYDGIDYQLYSSQDQLKYDFIVQPGADPSDIEMEYEGLEKMVKWYDELHLITSVNEIVEQKPYAYQLINGIEVEVKSEFILRGNKVQFKFPNGYDKTKELIIDPVWVFSSYTGSSKDNWGYTATYDHQGNLYGGGIVFQKFGANSAGTYPTIGAYQATYNGGQIDMGISKFSTDGSTLLYSTYLGGNGCDAPHSLVVDNNNDLVIFGSSGSSDYPTSVDAFDSTFNGGTSQGIGPSSFITYNTGSDIVVSKFSATGTLLKASTYVGGPQNDGLNLSGPLVTNYGDESRGEVFIDGGNNVYVSSSTRSVTGFPTVNAVQNSFGGGNQDGCVFKLSSDMKTMVWSTYLGGTGEDAAYSVQVDGGGNTLVAGGTNSFNFPTTAGTIQPSRIGMEDGFITKISPAGDSIVASTYIGTNRYDQNYFVQLDGGDSVYVVGQTEGNYPTTPSGIFSQPNGGQYIHKLSPGLDSTIFSTKFGTNRNRQIDISLSAFLVNDCDHIYVSGWGGRVNQLVATGSTTTGLLTTQGAHKTTTDGSDFYLIALAENADSVIYATFFGSNSLDEHVDGGTSRFDKKGVVYQAVCAGCGNSDAFPTTPTAWAKTNPGPNCNLGVIKFDMSKPFSDIQLSSPPYVCIPGIVAFGNNSQGTDFFWDFGDGQTSTDFAPFHQYKDTGTYLVALIVSDSALCVTTDTSYVTIRGIPPPLAEATAPPPICRGESIQLISAGGTSRSWFPPTGLSSDTAQSPLASPDTSTTYRLIVTDSCSSDTAFVRVEVNQNNTYVMPDTLICKGQELVLQARGGTDYNWIPNDGSLNNPNIATPIASPNQTTAYFVTIKDENQCIWEDTILVEVDPDIPEAKVSEDTTICGGGVAFLNAAGGEKYEWQPTDYLDNPNISNPVSRPEGDILYTVSITNACGEVEGKVFIEVDKISVISVGDSIACKGAPARLMLAGADYYLWEPAEFLNKNDISNPIATISEPTLFSIYAENDRGCSLDTTFLLGLREPPYLELGPDLIVDWGKGVRLNPTGIGKYKWEPPIELNCNLCPNPVVTPQKSRVYTAKLTDQYGCVAVDSMRIIVSGSIFIPNTFTPNGDNTNDYFRAITNELQSFKIKIFNRWGEILFESDDADFAWDGKLNGKDLPVDAYVWIVEYRDFTGKEKTKRGLINLLR